jgi:predicted Co/Zn/Cd cation transporter (cation efflux family)
VSGGREQVGCVQLEQSVWSILSVWFGVVIARTTLNRQFTTSDVLSLTNISIEGTVLHLQLQYTMGQGLAVSNIFRGGLDLQMQMSIVSPGAQPFGV